MFATMRRKSRSARMKNELGQSVDHFKRAASLAAQETGATVGPRFNAAKGRVQPAAAKARDAAHSGWDSALAALTPLVGAAADNAKQAGKQAGKTSRRAAKKMAKEDKKQAAKLQKRANKALGRKRGGSRAGKLAGYALLGTAVGMGAAYVARRRREAQWDEYDPALPTGSAQPVGATEDAAFEPIEQSSKQIPR